MNSNNLSSIINDQRKRDRTPELHFKLPSGQKIATAVAKLLGTGLLAGYNARRPAVTESFGTQTDTGITGTAPFTQQIIEPAFAPAQAQAPAFAQERAQTFPEIDITELENIPHVGEGFIPPRFGPVFTPITTEQTIRRLERLIQRRRPVRRFGFIETRPQFQ